MININLVKKIVVISVLFAVIVSAFEMFPKFLFPIKYKEYVYKYSSQRNLDPYIVFAVIKAESGFDTFAVSRKKARGLMQITEKTANWGASAVKYNDFSPEDLFIPEKNINIGTWYLGILMKEFKGDIDLVLAAYNGGSGNVNVWLQDKSLGYTGQSSDKIPFKETREFVTKVKNYYKVYQNIYKNQAGSSADSKKESAE